MNPDKKIIKYMTGIASVCHYEVYRPVILLLLSFAFLPIAGLSQTIVYEQQFLDSVIKNHPAFKIAELKVLQYKAQQKSAFNLPNPEVVAESPTGDFYTIGVLQQIEFPTVYIRQKQLAEQQTTLSEKEKKVTAIETRYLAKLLYLNFQYSASMMKLLHSQDSIYAELSEIADRKFEVGDIDLISKTYANSQYGEVHAKYLSEQANYAGYASQLKIYMNLKDSVSPALLGKSLLVIPGLLTDTLQLQSSPSIQYYEQVTKVNEAAWKVEKNKALPGIVAGYLNQGPEYTPSNLRFRAGITIPLWFWQYTGNIKSARYSFEAAKEEQILQEQQLMRNIEFLKQQIFASALNLSYYEKTGMKQADELYEASRRFYESSEWDGISFLRIANDAFAIKVNYYMTLKSYNEFLLHYHFLNGTL